jgi:hypothetical protein
MRRRDGTAYSSAVKRSIFLICSAVMMGSMFGRMIRIIRRKGQTPLETGAAILEIRHKKRAVATACPPFCRCATVRFPGYLD